MTEVGPVRRLGRRPRAARRSTPDGRRSGLPPHDAVPAGAAARLPRDPLPRQHARTTSGPPWSSPWPRCSTIPRPPRSPRRPPSRSPPSGTCAARVGLGDQRLQAAALRCVQTAAELAPPELRRRDAEVVAPGGAGQEFGRRLRRPRRRQRGRGGRQSTGGDDGVTTREALARELTSARERTLRLVEIDDAELLRQYDPLMSPLVWDLAHIGWQEEMWLLRGNDPRRPGLLPTGRRRALRRLRALAGQPRRPAAAAADGRAVLLRTVRATSPSTRSMPCPTTTARASTRPSSSAWWSATRTSTTRRCCRR